MIRIYRGLILSRPALILFLHLTLYPYISKPSAFMLSFPPRLISPVPSSGSANRVWREVWNDRIRDALSRYVFFTNIERRLTSHIVWVAAANIAAHHSKPAAYFSATSYRRAPSLTVSICQLEFHGLIDHSPQSILTTTHLRVSKLKTVPKIPATSVQVKMMTLYGILKSGVARSTSSARV